MLSLVKEQDDPQSAAGKGKKTKQNKQTDTMGT